MDRIDEYTTYLKPLCEQHNVPFEMIREMLQIELEKVGMRRRHNVFTMLREVVEKYVGQEAQDDSALVRD